MKPSDFPSIEKRQPDPAGLDFDGLRQAGIDLLQEMCGQVWTDYNLHDPGVTMLEQLCFGLTDLEYRTGFATEDYLYGPQGRIDGPRHALLPPEEALSCQPLTPEDYKKLFADALPEVRNVWVEADKEAPVQGLLNIYLQLTEGMESRAELAQDVLSRATALFHSHRNLCEDLGKIGLVGHRDYRLVGEIEITNARMPPEILADIYFACLTTISPPIPLQPYHQLTERGLEHLFDGPLTRQGYIDAQTFRPWNGTSLSELVRAVSSVAGVSRITALELQDSQGQPCQAAEGDPVAKQMPRLAIPNSQLDLGITLRLAGQERKVALGDFLARLARLSFTTDSRHHGRPDSEPISPLPEGSPPAFSEYSSIQHHFPPAYGIAGYGIPDSAPPARKAQAKQLQAYLLIFDQVMANFMQGLQELPRLFSVDESLDRTYFHQVIDNRDLPGLEFLYQGGLNGAKAGLDETLTDLDDFGDRRSRSLDFLLALHGEKFSQHSLRNFSALAGRPLEEDLVRAKIAFLQRAPYLNGRRMGAFDYRRGPSEDNLPALAEKLGLLLGIGAQIRQPLTALMRTQGFRHVRDSDFSQAAGFEFTATLTGDEVAIPLAPEIGEDTGDEAQSSILDKRVLCKSLLNGGPDLTRYRLVGTGRGCHLYFSLQDENGTSGGYCLLSRHDSKREAVERANRLSRDLAAFISDNLGFYLVEHILLRPVEPVSAQATDHAFYSFRISAVFPAWSPRLCNPEFRKLVEETLFLCSPAHIHIEAIWLEFEQMAVFEHLYWAWLRQQNASDAPPQSTADTARPLALFLQRSAQKAGEQPRWV